MMAKRKETRAELEAMVNLAEEVIPNLNRTIANQETMISNLRSAERIWKEALEVATRYQDHSY